MLLFLNLRRVLKFRIGGVLLDRLIFILSLQRKFLDKRLRLFICLFESDRQLALALKLELTDVLLFFCCFKIQFTAFYLFFF